MQGWSSLAHADLLTNSFTQSLDSFDDVVRSFGPDALPVDLDCVVRTTTAAVDLKNKKLTKDVVNVVDIGCDDDCFADYRNYSRVAATIAMD